MVHFYGLVLQNPPQKKKKAWCVLLFVFGFFLHLQKSKCSRKRPVTQPDWYWQMIVVRAAGLKCVFTGGWDPVGRRVCTRAVLRFWPKVGDNPTIYPLLHPEQHPVFTFKKKRTFKRQLWGPDNQKNPRRQVKSGATSSPGSEKAPPRWRQLGLVDTSVRGTMMKARHCARDRTPGTIKKSQGARGPVDLFQQVRLSEDLSIAEIQLLTRYHDSWLFLLQRIVGQNVQLSIFWTLNMLIMRLCPHWIFW